MYRVKAAPDDGGVKEPDKLKVFVVGLYPVTVRSVSASPDAKARNTMFVMVEGLALDSSWLSAGSVKVHEAPEPVISDAE